MRKPIYLKSITVPSNNELERMNFDQISRILDKLVQTEDEEGFLVKSNQVNQQIQIIDCDFRGGEKRAKSR